MRILWFLLLGCILMPLSSPVADVPPVKTETDSMSQYITDQVQALCIYQVRNGRTIARVFTGPELKANPDIHVTGYVSGVVLLSPDPIDAQVAGRRMRPMKIKADGTYDLSAYGSLAPGEIAAAFRKAGQINFDQDQINRLKGRYAFFPKVPGDAISTQNQFSITLNGSGQTVELSVYQTGSTRICAVPGKPDSPNHETIFHYMGDDPQQFESNVFATRMAAISAGIRTVEKAMGKNLVSAVNLLDYEGPNNALTCNGRTEIWIYTQTLWSESPEELRAIAEHETLHILTDQGRFSKSTALRELFANLRGLDAMSLERFALVTTGNLPITGRTANPVSDHILFAFINEMNFFKGMKGGHSRDNLDEFCTSFLHTLLYSENLDQALRTPVILPGGAGTRKLSPADQASLLEDYLHVLQNMNQVAAKDPANESIKIFLQDRLQKTRQSGDRSV